VIGLNAELDGQAFLVELLGFLEVAEDTPEKGEARALEGQNS
jgi:hypothetical protein